MDILKELQNYTDYSLGKSSERIEIKYVNTSFKELVFTGYDLNNTEFLEVSFAQCDFTDTDKSLTLDLGPISINMSVGNFDPLE